MNPTDSRTKMIASAALLIRERGVEGTSFRNVLEHSGAPRGSIYYHFPDGKMQLVGEATRFAGDYIAAGLVAALRDHDVQGALASFITTWQTVLEDSDFAAGCPIVAAALEGNGTVEIKDAAARAFSSWEQPLVAALIDRGVDAGRAESLATLAIASIEGAIVLARAERTSEPLRRVGLELQTLFGLALPAAPS